METSHDSLGGAYTLRERLRASARSVVYRGVRVDDGHPVILKTARSERPSRRELEALQHEHEVLRHLDTPLVSRPVALEPVGGRLALILEDSGGQPLDQLLGKPMPVEQFLSIAQQLATALEHIHSRGVVHKDLKPQNILFDQTTGHIQLIDFGISTLSPFELQSARHPSMLEGALAYMSPEQTGRMNRALDHRTDLYSLGITFYEMLTGRLPFEAVDPLGWVHCHIAKPPRTPDWLKEPVSPGLWPVVTKLLSKAAEDRYQSALGLRLDLEECSARWARDGAIAPFPLGERDVSERFQIPQKIYGRERELAQLHAAFERVIASGRPELVFISGYSGIGKSALVRELHKPVVRERGFFISGKFDVIKLGIPYSTLIDAFRELVFELLSESEATVSEWRERLRRALGDQGRVIVDVLPPVELLLGPQPPVPELPPQESEARFVAVFRQFLAALARRAHPLVLFLDDLQWADFATLRLLEKLFEAPGHVHLLLLGTYRNNEVDLSHPLARTLRELRGYGAALGEIELAPLDAEQLGALVRDALHCDLERAQPLAALIHEKTEGNPFFSIQFLSALHQEQLLQFDVREKAWHWDLERIRAKGFTDNVIDLMVRKLQRLGHKTQEVMKLAACMGPGGDLKTLAVVCEQPLADTARDLRDAVRSGLMSQSGDDFRFLHDRLEQAAYSLIPEDERPRVHLRVGRRLLETAANEDREDRLFDVVNQLNRGAELIHEPTERLKLAELNLRAGDRAKGSLAHRSAMNYYAAGLQALRQTDWEAHYDLAFDLQLGCIRSAYLCGEFERAEQLSGELLTRARTPVDRVKVYRQQIALNTTRGEMLQAIRSGLEALQLFAMELPADPSRKEVESEYARVWQNLGGQPIEGLVNLSPMQDPELLAASEVLSDLITPALFQRRELFYLILGRIVNLSIQHGATEASIWAYVCFGSTLLQTDFAKYAEGYRFGKLGYELMVKGQHAALRSRVSLIFGDICNPYARHLRSDRPFIDDAFQSGVQNGDLAYACYSCNHVVSNMLALGEPLERVFAESEARLDFVRKAKDANIEAIILAQQRYIQNLRGLTRSFSTFDGPDFDQTSFEERIAASQMKLMICWYYVLKLQARVFSAEPDEALVAAEKAKAFLDASGADLQVTDYNFYTALALSARFEIAPESERVTLLARIREHEVQLRTWATHCPENFLPGQSLVAAELARLEQRLEEAETLYEKAIHAARESGFIHLEGLAYETAARHYLSRGLDKFGATYLREARQCYERWGADGKVAQLDQKYLGLSEGSPLASSTTVSVNPRQLDLLAVTKASQTISQEMFLPRLRETLMRIIFEQSGAQTGYLLLAEGDGRYTIQASQRPDTSRAEPQSLAEVPTSIVNLVGRTGELVLVDDPAQKPRFSADPYIQSHKPRSVLCLPLRRGAKVTGMLYLENSAVSGAFKPETLTALEILATQAAISLENASLYSQAQDAVRVRDEFLSIASHELKTPLTPLRLQLELIEAAVKESPENRSGRRIRTALAQVDRLGLLIDNLLDVSQISSGRFRLSLEPTDLSELVRESVTRLEPALKTSGLHLDVPPGIVVVLDRQRIEQVLTNLLTNASKFGGGSPISVSLSRDDELVRLTVSDRGEGISPDFLPRIFERFERGISEKAYAGLGLGLYIVTRIVDAHRGKVQVKSRPGAGATFIVELPRGGAPSAA